MRVVVAQTQLCQTACCALSKAASREVESKHAHGNDVLTSNCREWGLVLYAVLQTGFLCREESAHKIDLGIVSALVTDSAAS